MFLYKVFGNASSKWWLSLFLSLPLSISISISLSLYLSISLYLYLSLSLSVSLCLSLSLSVSLSLCFSLCFSLSLCLSLFLSLYLSISLSISLYLSLLSLSRSIYKWKLLNTKIIPKKCHPQLLRLHISNSWKICCSSNWKGSKPCSFNLEMLLCLCNRQRVRSWQ